MHRSGNNRRPPEPPPPPLPEGPEEVPSAERVRPPDPFLRFFQDCLMVFSPEQGEEGPSESFLDRKAREFNVPPTEIRPVRRIAEYLAHTPFALVEVSGPAGVDEEDGEELEGMMAFVTPAYGDFVGVTRERLERAGYVLRHTGEGACGELEGYVVEHPETEVSVSVRTYGVWALAQGPVGFQELVGIFAKAILRNSEMDDEGGLPQHGDGDD